MYGVGGFMCIHVCVCVWLMYMGVWGAYVYVCVWLMCMGVGGELMCMNVFFWECSFGRCYWNALVLPWSLAITSHCGC